MDSLPEMSQLQSLGLPSPSALMLPESAPSPPRGALGGESSSPTWLGLGRPTSAAAAAAAAARAEQYLRSSKEGLDELLRCESHICTTWGEPAPNHGEPSDLPLATCILTHPDLLI